MTAQPAVHITSLGCARNEVDSEELAGRLAAGGFALVDDPATAEIVVVNTCGFIDAAKKDSIDTLLAAADLKDSGTVRLDVGEVMVIADLPKRVDWDQEELATLVAAIRAEDQDPGEYVDTVYRVPERKYAAWPRHIRTAFAPARTVKTGKPTFQLALREER